MRNLDSRQQVRARHSGHVKPKELVDSTIEASFAGLSPKLQLAARYVAANPKVVAMESMRATAAKAALTPATMLRLARALGFETYDSFRDVYRVWLTGRDSFFSTRANALKSRPDAPGDVALVRELIEANIRNLEQTFNAGLTESIQTASALMTKARQVYVVGLRSLFSVGFYFNYVSGLFHAHTTLLSGTGGTFADELRRIGPNDVLVAFSYEPYSQGAVRAVKFARQRGAKIVAVTDSALSPAARGADAQVMTVNETPSLLPSVVPAMAVAEILAAVLVRRSGARGLQEIDKSEEQLKMFSVYVSSRQGGR